MNLLLAVIVVLVLVISALCATLYVKSRKLQEIEIIYGLSSRIPLAPREPIRAHDATPKTYEQRREEADWLIKLMVDPASQGGEAAPVRARIPEVLQEACEDALSGGKRIRAAIVLEVAQALNYRRAERREAPIDCAETAVALEFLHASSLVVDDMPHFDDDPERRGAPAVHAKHGPAKAQMAALTLMFAAQEELAYQTETVRRAATGNPDRLGLYAAVETARVIREAAAGQTEELSGAQGSAQNGDPPSASLEVTQKKTAGLFELAFELPYIFVSGDLDEERLADIRGVGTNFGVAFQIADDLADLEADRERGVPNFADTFGVEAAEREVQQRLNAARLTLNQYNLLTPTLEEIITLVSVAQ